MKKYIKFTIFIPKCVITYTYIGYYKYQNCLNLNFRNRNLYTDIDGPGMRSNRSEVPTKEHIGHR